MRKHSDFGALAFTIVVIVLALIGGGWLIVNLLERAGVC